LFWLLEHLIASSIMTTTATTAETRKRHLTDVNVEENPLSVRELIRDWCKDDTATEAQLERLDDYVRAGIMDESQAGEVRYKWFRKGAFAQPGAWEEWTQEMETQHHLREWRAYLAKKRPGGAKQIPTPTATKKKITKKRVTKKKKV
jgi:hypothetical protein